jgi:hypothetical protein
LLTHSLDFCDRTEKDTDINLYPLFPFLQNGVGDSWRHFAFIAYFKGDAKSLPTVRKRTLKAD